MREYEIRLENVMIYAYHGVFEHERRDGNVFEINLCVRYTGCDSNDDIENTVSYVVLWGIVKEEMTVPRKLLETVARNISEKINARFPNSTFIECKLTKKQPPIKNFTGEASVVYRIIN